MYDHSQIEAKMQQYWKEIDAYNTDPKSGKEKKYILDMFPYPSGAGLHVGHVEGYTATDIMSRYLRMKGYEVLHPMGWDAFGLPAENYAIKVGKHPRISTDENIKNFIRQLNSVGFSYDWDHEIDTSSEEYYKWSQWFFLFLYKQGLAYRKESPVNWCNTCQTVLANEQVVDGKCERSKDEVVQKNLPQWFFKVTAYADRLVDDLAPLEWPESLKEMQRNWIGRSKGASLQFKVDGSSEQIEVFTTRPDTLFGATYMVLAPEHALVKQITTDEQRSQVETYIETTKKKSDLDRQADQKEKTGVFTGAYAINPINQEKIPVWIADYVLSTYGTGAIMAVPAHDQRDFAFAKKFNLPIKQVISGDEPVDSACIGDGDLINSGEYNGMSIDEAKVAITKAAGGEMTTTYRIRDWLISRQRFWGAPIPIVYCDDCGIVAVEEKNLPVRLPKEADFELKGDGKSPLARNAEFVNVACPKCAKPAKRETDTMDGFVDNSWYFFRYTDPKNDEMFASKEAIHTWLPVDLYVGGAEHAVGHLIYSRFFTKVLFDNGYIDFEEPFKKLVNQGLIMGEDGQKMSKSLGNVINPDDVVAQHGADTMRIFEMFMGPLTDAKPWDTKGIVGAQRFLDKIHRFYRETDGVQKEAAADPAITKQLHQMIAKVEKDIEHLHYNTAIAIMMEFMNAVQKKGELPLDQAQDFLRILHPFAPHMAEYLWKELGQESSITKEAWPVADARLLQDDEVVMAIQVNGKVRGDMAIAVESNEEEARAKALQVENVIKHIAGAEIKKVIYVKGKIINFIV